MHVSFLMSFLSLLSLMRPRNSGVWSLVAAPPRYAFLWPKLMFASFGCGEAALRKMLDASDRDQIHRCFAFFGRQNGPHRIVVECAHGDRAKAEGDRLQ